MKPRKLILFALSLSALTGAWTMASYKKQAAIGAATAAASDCTPVGQIFSVENDSEISEGQLLCLYDVLEPAPEAKVMAVCFAEGTSWQVPSGIASEVSNGCVATCKETDENGKCIDDDNIRPACPNIEIMSPSPYPGKISNPRPFLSWEAVPGAIGYAVRVQDVTGSGVAWEIEVSNPNATVDAITIAYPEGEYIDPLEPGEKYKIKVEALSDESSESCMEPGQALFELKDPSQQDLEESDDIR